MSGPAGRKRIADYGLIGDGETAALVGRDGAIEWMCMPRFDSEACFASLLGGEERGFWRIAPEEGGPAARRRYLDDTLILETLFETDGGSVAVIDFMPIRGQAPDVVRIVEGRSGSVSMMSVLDPKFDYGRIRPVHQRRSEGEMVAFAGPNGLVLRFDAPIECEDGQFTSRFTIGEGERVSFAMTWFPAHEQQPDPIDPQAAIDETRSYWEDWIKRSTYCGPHRNQVVRSLLTLKALIHAPTGAIVAAPTASLPERSGGSRNWDYRYCWLRDATFTLLALIHSGLGEEAEAWVNWLRRAIAGEPVDIQPFYTVEGRRHAPETNADWLAGFNGATPVRIGNAAVGQLQLDIYGEVLDTLLVACEHKVDEDNDSLFRLLARKLEGLWQQPDAGIWESRGEPVHHVYSKVMCWAAFDRAAQWFEHDEDLRRRYAALAEQVKAEVLDRGFDAEQNSFVRAYEDKALDAAILRLPLVGFLPADDPRIVGTVAAIERELMHNGLVHRYTADDTDDGVGGKEGAFVACSFWLADVYALQGRMDDARALFGRLCAATNDLGLLSEEIAVEDGRLLGNFPQALSHLSLVATAMNLSERGGPAQERGRSAAD